ncbi:MAG: type II secretion system minor pseudopilin GspK [bacterium]
MSRQRPRPNRHQQRGIALLTAITITTIAVTIAAVLLYRQQYTIQLTGNLAHREQAYHYVDGMEQWACLILTRDRREGASDHRLEDWAQGKLLPPTPIDGGEMSGFLDDLQARINLNNVLAKPPTPNNNQQNNSNSNQQNPLNSPTDNHNNDETIPKHANKYWFKTLQNLLNEKELSAATSDVLLDWLDEDQQTTGGNGAESDFYLTLERSYFAANSAMVTPTSLRLLKPVDEKIYDTLIPYISVLPNTTAVNVNTAPKTVLLALGFSPDAAQNILDQREDNPLENPQEALQFMPEDERKNIAPEAISVDSQYFLLRGYVQIAEIHVSFNSIIHRNPQGQAIVIQREFAPIYPEANESADNNENLDNV